MVQLCNFLRKIICLNIARSTYVSLLCYGAIVQDVGDKGLEQPSHSTLWGFSRLAFDLTTGIPG